MKRKVIQTLPKKKKQLVNTSRIIASPSPVKNHFTSNAVEQEQQQDKDIIIKHSELVLFTQKFALEKADYEDRISYLESEIEMYQNKCAENANNKIQFHLSRSKQLDPINYQTGGFQTVAEVNNNYELLKQESENNIKLLQQKTAQCVSQRLEIEKLQQSLKTAEQLYSKIKAEVSELRIAELEKVRESLSQKSMIDNEERVKVLECDIMRLRNLNELFRTQLKNQDIEIKEKNQMIEDLQNQIMQMQMKRNTEDRYEDDYRSRIDGLESEREHLQNQLFLQKANNKRYIDLQRKYSDLKQQVVSKNHAIVQLTQQKDHDAETTNKLLVAKCQQLELQIQRLNKVIIKLNTQNTSKFKASADKQSFSELSEYKRKYSQMLESMKNFQSQNQQSQKFPPIDQLMNELEENPSRVKLMQNIISGLRSQNNELKSIIQSESNSLCQNAQNQLRQIIYEMTRNKIQKDEENQTLRFKVQQLKYEIQKHKNSSKSLNTLSSKHPLSQTKKKKLQGLLSKISQYSKQFTVETNTFEGDLYEMIIGKLLDHISNLESQNHYYSYSLDN